MVMTWEEVRQNATKAIKSAAFAHCRPGHFALNREDLEGEGWQVYVEVLNSHLDIEPENFYYLFRKCLDNHFKELIRLNLYTNKRMARRTVDVESIEIVDGKEVVTVEQKEQSVETYVDLSDVANFIGYLGEGLTEALLREYVAEVKSIIKSDPELLKLFEILIDTPKEVEEIVWSEYLRKKHVSAQGIQVKFTNVCTPAKRHFRKFLGWDVEDFNDKFNQLRTIVKGVIEDFGMLSERGHAIGN